MPLTISSHVIALAVIGVKRMIPDSVIATAFLNICLPPRTAVEPPVIYSYRYYKTQW